MEKVEAHCERFYDDQDETSQMQEDRIQELRHRGDCLGSWTRRKVEITVDRVLRAREKMMKTKANCPSDCLMTEMLKEHPMESVHEITHWFGECRTPAPWEILRLVFLKKPDAKQEKGIRCTKNRSPWNGRSCMLLPRNYQL